MHIGSADMGCVGMAPWKIYKAAKQSGARVLLQSGWSELGIKGEDPRDHGCFIMGRAPHDWLMQRCSGVVHHGGAGTTAAGLRCGLPTFICPFFGDQHFWGEMVGRAHLGPKPCPVHDLTASKGAKVRPPRSSSGTSDVIPKQHGSVPLPVPLSDPNLYFSTASRSHWLCSGTLDFLCKTMGQFSLNLLANSRCPTLHKHFRAVDRVQLGSVPAMPDVDNRMESRVQHR